MSDFNGKKVAIIGKLSQDTSQIAAVISAEGATVGAIGPGTNYVIAGAGADAAELAKAKAAGASVIDEATMRSMIGP